MSSPTDVFFGKQNVTMLQRVLYNDICRRYGNDLNEKQATRLMKTVQHYMSEVYRVQGDKPAPMLNKEVLSTVLPDYMMYLERSKTSSSRSVVSDIEAGNGQESVSMERIERIEDVQVTRSRMDVSNAFSELQAQRQDVRPKPPAVKDFHISLQDEAPVSLDNFDRIRKEREAEALRTTELIMAQAQQQPGQQQPGQQQYLQQQRPTSGQGQQMYAEATDMFSRDRRRANDEADALYAERERQRLQARAQTELPVPPDMRSLYLGDKQVLSRTMNTAAGNPTIALPTTPEPSRGLQQMIVTREPDTMAYKETELNLFVYSGDRDWVSNSTETRYNFTVNFNPSNTPSGLRISPTATAKFRNIVRVELVKAIMPGEGLDLMVTKTATGTYDSSLNMNILSYPYIQVRIPELDNNIYGTNLGLNAAFGVLQYDANWVNDSNNSQQRGYLAMIPKFLKCQKVYSPTPLATIQKLSFRFERPDGTLLSQGSDTLDISRIYPTLAMTTSVFTATNALLNPSSQPTTVYQKDNATDVNGSSYFWLQTSTYFNHWTVSKGDRILIQNLTWTNPATGGLVSPVTDLTNYLQGSSGLLVVATGIITGTGTSAIFSDGNAAGDYGYNQHGYANAILVRGKFQDPTTTGTFLPYQFGGVADSYTSGNLSYYLVNTGLTAGRLLNQSHQVQVALRIITREYDSTGILRPDNL
jgi:hypothetical protein